EVFLSIVSEQVFDILTDERRRIIPARFEAVDYRRRASEQVLDARAGLRHCCLRSLSIGDIAPRANHLDRLALFVPDESLFVVYPAVAVILLEKPILDRVGTFLEQVKRLGLDGGELVGVHAVPPEIRIFQVLLRLVTEPIPDVLADEGRREIPRCLVAVDDRRSRRQKASGAVLRWNQGFADLLARRDVVPRAHHLDRIASRVTQQLQFVADPAVAAVLLAEAVFNAEVPLRK